MNDFSRDTDKKPGEDDDFILPNAREVNRQLRAESKREKAKEKKRGKGEGSHKKLFEEACALHPRDPLAQICYYLYHCILLAAIGRLRHVSEKTKSDFGDLLKSVVKLLRMLRRPLQSFEEFGRSHVLALMQYWEQQGHAEATIQWRVSLMRRFFTLIGKPQVLPVGAEWRKILVAKGITAGTLGRTQVATEPRGWADRGVDPLSIIEAMRIKHPVVASQVEVCLYFGLRKSEGTHLRPGRNDKGLFLEVLEGSKGGRPRMVEFDDNPDFAAKQREVLARAKELVAKNGILMIPGRTLKQMTNHVNYVLRKFKVTKKGLGVTQHGLRHQFLCDLFARRTGLPAMVLGQLPAEVYEQNADKVREGQRHVTQQAGHERLGITGAYTGSIAALKKDSDRRLVGWVQAADKAGDAFGLLQVEEAWIVGKASYGLPLRTGEALQICVRIPSGVLAREGLPDDIARCGAALTAHMGVPVTISVNVDGIRPADGVEITFQRP